LPICNVSRRSDWRLQIGDLRLQISHPRPA
jgi:hypothetical protein